MSSGWERIRVRIETKEEMPPPAAAQDTRTISTHILDTAVGRAAANVQVTLHRLLQTAGDRKHWEQLQCAETDADGRVAQLLDTAAFTSGIYKLHFNVQPYFEAQGVQSFYPFIEIVVNCVQGQHYHIPLLLSPFGYSTYRGT